jgi:hypothetical protein
VQENYTPIDHINSWKENQKSAYFSKNGKHVINHPGEVPPAGLVLCTPVHPSRRKIVDGHGLRVILLERTGH